MDVVMAGARTEAVTQQLDACQEGLLLAFRCLFRSADPAPPCPSPLALGAGDVVVVVSGSDRGSPQTRNAVLDSAANAGVTVIDDSPGGLPVNRRAGRVSLVIATHHSVASAAQHRAMSCHAPVLLPDSRCSTPGPLRLWLRPVPTLALTGPDRQLQIILCDLHLRGVLPAVPDEDHPALIEVFARPSENGLLLGVTGGIGAAVSFCSGPRTVRIPATATADGVTQTLKPGTYRIALAQPPLYRLHAEPVPRPETGRIR